MLSWFLYKLYPFIAFHAFRDFLCSISPVWQSWNLFTDTCPLPSIVIYPSPLYSEQTLFSLRFYLKFRWVKCQKRLPSGPEWHFIEFPRREIRGMSNSFNFHHLHPLAVLKHILLQFVQDLSGVCCYLMFKIIFIFFILAFFCVCFGGVVWQKINTAPLSEHTMKFTGSSIR